MSIEEQTFNSIQSSLPTNCTIPLNYIIDYSDHLEKPDFVEKLRSSPPQFLHVAYDLVYVSRWGAKREDKPSSHRICASEFPSKIEEVREFIREVKNAGVERLIPYICDQTIAGDPKKRLGFWEFYDHWDEYSEFDIGQKPADDPLEWMQREPWGKIHFNYPYRFEVFDPPYRWAPCPSNPNWRCYLEGVVANIARLGYDGVFVDNNIIHCFCQSCQEGFKSYLKTRYSKSELKRCFGTENVDDIKLSTAGDKIIWAKSQHGFLKYLSDNVHPKILEEKLGGTDPSKWDLDEAGGGFLWSKSHDYLLKELAHEHGLETAQHMLLQGELEKIGISTPEARALWAETQKYWAQSVSDLLGMLRESGRRINKDFIVVPNWGAMAGIRETDGRRVDGKNVAIYSPNIDYVMFEDRYFPGSPAPGVIFDYVLHYKHALSCGTRAVILPYFGANEWSTELALAEAAAFSGGGAFVQPNHSFPKLRERFRLLYAKQARLWEGMRPYARVGLIYSFDQVQMENMEHLRQVYVLSQQLLDSQIPFDLLSDDYADQLEGYEMVIFPNIRYVSDSELVAIKRFLGSGGKALVVGDAFSADETGKTRNKPCLENLLKSGELKFVSAEEAAPDLQSSAYHLVDLKKEDLEPCIESLRQEGGIKRPGKLVDIIRSWTGKSYSLIEGPKIPLTLRINAFTNAFHMVAHFVNYDAPTFGSSPEQVLGDLHDLRLSIKWQTGGARTIYYEPTNPDGLEIENETGRECLDLVIPHLSVYGILSIIRV